MRLFLFIENSSVGLKASEVLLVAVIARGGPRSVSVDSLV